MTLLDEIVVSHSWLELYICISGRVHILHRLITRKSAVGRLLGVLWVVANILHQLVVLVDFILKILRCCAFDLVSSRLCARMNRLLGVADLLGLR
jgi:hypothetical protein